MDRASDRVNPYQVPSVPVQDVMPEGSGRPLARRGTRLAATILDGLIYLIGPLIALIAFGPSRFDDPNLLWAAYALIIPALLVNLYFLWRDGQSLGKKALRIQIVRTDQTRASLSRVFLLRMLAPSLIGAIPIAGPFFSLADALFIFSAARRCIHDHMADTIVVQAP